MGLTSSGFSGPLRQPTFAELFILGGNSTAYTQDVFLQFWCRAAWDMQVANGSDPTGAPWQQFQSSIPWTLPLPFNSPHVVSVRYRLHDGNFSEVALATIYLAESVPQTGACGKAMDNLRILLSYSPNFQDWTGTLDNLQAKSYIHRHIVQRPFVHPFALITEVPDFTPQRIGGERKRVYESTGSLNLMFEGKIESSVEDPEDVNWEQEILIFKSKVCPIISDLLDMTCQMGPHGKVFLCIDSLEEADAITIPDPDDLIDPTAQDFTMQVNYRISWR